MLVLVGEYEQKLAPFQEGAPDADKRRNYMEKSRMVDNAKEMADRLATVKDLSTTYQSLPGENHTSVLSQSLNLGVRHAFGQ